ncbi:MAG: transglutaminase domain-containing protein [Nitrospirota bacterium]
MRAYSFSFRVTVWTVLTCFLWSFGPLFQIPAAFAAEKQKAASVEQAPGKPVSREQKPEEKFEGVLEAIREKVGKASEKNAKGEDASAEIREVGNRKTQLADLNEQLQAEFAATEKKIAGLPREIRDRHTAFVKNYTANYTQLRDELNDIDAARTPAERKAKIEKVRLHLDKTRPKKLVQRLDPENLPFRVRKATKTVAPRLKKEEFERDFRKQKSHSSRNISDSRLMPDLLASKPQSKPVLLAFNEIASDVPLQLPRPLVGEGGGEGAILQVAFADSAPILLAQQTADIPTAADLSETPEVQFTPEIRAKAAELGNSPLRIYEWVRNNIEYAPTYGSIQGADQCLQSRICNDTDTASLLIALLRTSGISARYAYGTVDIPIEKAMNWVGDVTNPMMVGTILATNGVPVTLLKTSGSVYKYVRMEHVWVSAFIDYIPSRGAVHRQPDTWIQLDPSFKQYAYTQGIDIQSAVPFDAQTFANQLQSTSTINETEGYVTNVNSTLIQQTMQDYQTQVQNYIQQNHPNATVGDVVGKKEIIKQEFGILPETLPYKTVQIGSQFAQVPDNLRATISFSIPDSTGAGTGLFYSASLPELAGKKITLSFSPATANDQAVIESFLPQPHPDGTPIQPSELPSSFPAYLINLKSELRIDGQIVATGAPGTMGSAQSFTMSLNEPGIGLSNIDNMIQAGEYYGIGLDTGRVGGDRLNALKAKLETTKEKIVTQTYGGITKDDVVGDLLFMTITTYFNELDLSDEIAAKAQDAIRYRVPSIGLCSTQLAVQAVFGIPTWTGFGGMMMDVDRIMQAVFSKNGNTDNVRKYMLTSGSMSSALEHLIPERMYSTPSDVVQGISAVKALQIASDQGISIYTVNQTNINIILPQLQVSEDVKSVIANAVNAGKEVTVPRTNVSYNDRLLCGYIITDPVTGAGAYMISSGENGALLLIGVGLLLLALSILAGPIAFAILSLLLPIYLAFLNWLMTEASSTAQDCVAAIALNILAAITVRNILIVFITFRPVQILINSIRMYFAGSATQSNCLGNGLAY